MSSTCIYCPSCPPFCCTVDEKFCKKSSKHQQKQPEPPLQHTAWALQLLLFMIGRSLFRCFISLLVHIVAVAYAGWFIALPECWQTAKYSDVYVGYNYAETQKGTTISECNLGYPTVTQNAKLFILFNAETHVRVNFGDTISDLDVAVGTRVSFSNSYCCVEIVK